MKKSIYTRFAVNKETGGAISRIGLCCVGLCCVLLSGCVVHRTADQTRTLSLPGVELPLQVPATAQARVHKPDRVTTTDEIDRPRKLIWPKWTLSNFFSKFNVPIQLNRRDYQVQSGDTLSEIAEDFRVSTEQLAKVNKLYSPHTIYAGQSLRMVGQRSEDRTQSAPLSQTQSAQNVKSNKKVVFDEKEVYKSHRFSTKKEDKIKDKASLYWRWPVEGALISRFQPGVSKGVAISGALADTVRAAADGSVVYAGDDVVGYGNLVILEHADGYITTYAHNSRLLVTEGQQVRAGARIAELGSTGTDQVKLHFEIRQRGKPVDPLRYLPSS